MKITLIQDGASFRISLWACPDACTCIGNVSISVNAAAGLKTNGFNDNFGGLAVPVETTAITRSGSVTIATDGCFTYTTPAIGFTG